MNGTMLKRGVMIFGTLMLQLLIAKAVVAGNENNATPWYAAWYLWIGLGVFIIVVVTVVGGEKNRDRS